MFTNAVAVILLATIDKVAISVSHHNFIKSSFKFLNSIIWWSYIIWAISYEAYYILWMLLYTLLKALPISKIGAFVWFYVGLPCTAPKMSRVDSFKISPYNNFRYIFRKCRKFIKRIKWCWNHRNERNKNLRMLTKGWIHVIAKDHSLVIRKVAAPWMLIE